MTMDEAKSDFDTIIDLQPTVEVEAIEVRAAYEQKAYNKGYADGKAGSIKHGYWKWNNQYGTECSECGTAMFEVIGHIFSSATPKYCPYCGAKMDEVEK